MKNLTQAPVTGFILDKFSKSAKTSFISCGHREVSRLLTSSKNFKCHILKDNDNSFHEVTLMGLKPLNVFFSLKCTFSLTI